MTVLLTGRGETNFTDLVKRILKSRSLDFDLVVLKPEVSPVGARFSSTMQFKQDFLHDLICTYRMAQEIRIYEDRPGHVKGFRSWFDTFNKSLLSHPIDQPPPPRKPINAEVIAVAEGASYLDPVTETCIVQNLINSHNAALSSPNYKNLNITQSRSGRKFIKRHFHYFGHLIKMTDSARLITLIDVPYNLIDTKEVQYSASSILISSHEPDNTLLERLGGHGRKVKWQTIGTAVWENKIWAAKCMPLIDDEADRLRIWEECDGRFPVVVLAVKKGNKVIDADRIREGSYRDLPPEKRFVFETVVGNREYLEICDENTNGVERGYDFNRIGFKRKYDGNSGYSRTYVQYTKENFPPLPSQRDRDQDRDRGIRDRDRDRDRDHDRDRDRDRDDFRPRRGGGNGGGRYFNAGLNEDTPNQQQRNFSANAGNRGNSSVGGRGGRGGGGGGNGGPGRRNDRDGGGPPRNRGGDRRDRDRDRDRDRGAGGGGRGGRMRGDGGGGGPRGYKSLDDFGGGGFGMDGGWDVKGSGAGEVVMNY